MVARQRGVAEDTWVSITADNGPEVNPAGGQSTGNYENPGLTGGLRELRLGLGLSVCCRRRRRCCRRRRRRCCCRCCCCCCTKSSRRTRASDVPLRTARVFSGGRKRDATEGGTREIGLVEYPPAVKANRVEAAFPIITMDLMATVLDIHGT